jgi:hypothetical protein
MEKVTIAKWGYKATIIVMAELELTSKKELYDPKSNPKIRIKAKINCLSGLVESGRMGRLKGYNHKNIILSVDLENHKFYDSKGNLFIADNQNQVFEFIKTSMKCT